MKTFGRQFYLKSPPKSNVVIFDSTNSEFVMELILKGLPSFVFEVRPPRLYIGGAVILHFFTSLRFFDWTEVKKRRAKLRGIASQLKLIYLLSCFACMKPKVVLTFIDNNPSFHWLSKNYRAAQFFAIQNGTRTKGEVEDNSEKQYYLQHFFCFGNYEKELYDGLGYVVDNYYPVGSLLGGYYKYNGRRNAEIKHHICVVSCWRGDIGNGIDVQQTMLSMRKMDSFLARYIEAYQLKACVVLRSEVGSRDRNIPVYGNEAEYFRRIYPEGVELIDPVFKERNVYKEMDRSELVVTFGSTAVREAFGWGKKILYCDFTGTDKYNDYDKTILFADENYESFKKRLNELRLMSDEDYRKLTKDYASYLMNYAPSCPPHVFVREKITECL